MNQVFSAYPKNSFLYYCIEKSRQNLKEYTVKEDYDILYIGANAMLSQSYDEYKNKGDIELFSIKQRDKMFKVSNKGSWRTD